MITCEDCGKKFYSDTDYETHQFLEFQKKILVESSHTWSKLINSVLGELQYNQVLDIALRQNIPFTDAYHYWQECRSQWTLDCLKHNVEEEKKE